MLKELVEDRKLPIKGIDYAATPNISAMNLTRSLRVPSYTFLICPFCIIFIFSYPFIVCLAVLNQLKLMPGLTNRFIHRRPYSPILLRYFLYRNFTTLANLLSRRVQLLRSELRCCLS